MPLLKELLETRGKLAKEIRRQADLVTGENREFTAEEKLQWDKVNDDYNNVVRQIDIAKRAEEVESASNEILELSTIARAQKPQGTERSDGVPTEQTRQLAFRAWYREQLGEDPADAELEACKRLNFNYRRKELIVPSVPSDLRARINEDCRGKSFEKRVDIIRRALSAFTPTTGGYSTLPVSMIQQLEVNQAYFSAVESVAETITTANGEPMTWPTADDTSNTGAQLAENTQVSTSAQPSFSQVTWYAHKFTSNAILCPHELLEDSQFDIAGLLGSMLGERLGRIANTRFTTGSGAGTVKGIVTCAATGHTTASGTAITADELIKSTSGSSSIDLAYRNMGFAWMMHDNIMTQIRYLKDGMGNYLWNDSLNGDAPQTLCGKPIVINNDMQSTLATSTVTFLYGLFSKYKVRRVAGRRIYRLEERYRDYDQDGFLAFERFDGNLLSAGTAVVKKITQA